MNTGAQSLSEVRMFTQADFDLFAALSGDDNPIHVDPDFAERTRFGRTVAHGMLLFTVLRGLVAKLTPCSSLETQELMFPSPTYAGDEMRFSVTLQAGTAEMQAVRIADDTLTCTGRARLRAPQP